MNRFRGYLPFFKEEVLTFMELSFLSCAYKYQHPISDIYDQNFLPHFKAAMSQNGLLLLIKLCHFNNAATRDKRKDDRLGHIREIWDTFNNRCR